MTHVNSEFIDYSIQDTGRVMYHNCGSYQHAANPDQNRTHHNASSVAAILLVCALFFFALTFAVVFCCEDDTVAMEKWQLECEQITQFNEENDASIELPERPVSKVESGIYLGLLGFACLIGIAPAYITCSNSAAYNATRLKIPDISSGFQEFRDMHTRWEIMRERGDRTLCGQPNIALGIVHSVAGQYLTIVTQELNNKYFWVCKLRIDAKEINPYKVGDILYVNYEIVQVHRHSGYGSSRPNFKPIDINYRLIDPDVMYRTNWNVDYLRPYVDNPPVLEGGYYVRQ